MTEVNLAQLGDRLLKLLPKIASADQRINTALEKAEDALEIKLGPQYFGWIELEPGLHLVYRDGLLSIERIRFYNGKFQINVDDVMTALRAEKILAIGKIQELHDDAKARGPQPEAEI